MKFEIESFFQFKNESKVKAGFRVKTEGGLIYDCKLVQGGANGYFVASAQQRSYDKTDGGKGYIDAFMALKDTPAARFFDDVATQAAALLKVEQVMGQEEPPPFDGEPDIPF